ncbi:MAG: phosphate transporter permease, partial [Frondihabitans sp.]|nr:phosphate transporter permease [Frondihabitans sp.]
MTVDNASLRSAVGYRAATTTLPEYPLASEGVASPRQVRQLLLRSDRAFRGVSRGGGTVVLTIMVLVAGYLTINAWPALAKVGIGEFLTTAQWSPETYRFGIAELLVGTVLIAVIALLTAFPLAIGTALFITEIARGSLKKTLTSVVDLMAAVPSVIFGLWGLAYLQGAIVPFSQWVSTWLGWFPPLRVDG